MDIQVSITILVAATLVSSLLLLHRRKSPSLPYPPGPIVTDMPALDSWAHYQNWSEQYGPLIYIRNRNTVIINDLQIAVDLLERRARIYSDRESSVVTKLTGVEDTNWVVQGYSDKWRKNRRTFQQTFRQATISCFYPTQYKEVHIFLKRLLTAPSDFMQHTMAFSQRNIYAGLYGLDVEAEHYIARKTAKVLKDLSIVQLPGNFPLLARFPWLRFFPSWFPGCDFKQLAEHIRKEVLEVASIPFDLAVNNLKSGRNTSILAELAIENEQNPEKVKSLQGMGFMSALAGADTTGASVSSFLLAMVIHPDIQAKGQEEIDRVVGPDRLPTFEDRRLLPFVESIYREVMRLDPPIPLCLAHASSDHDVYHGYFIPKGCTVIPNIWAMNRDPSRYPDPDAFRPERFLESPDGPFTDITDIPAFGFGRRICPGRYMADNSVWLAIVSVLATLTMSKAKNKEGNEIEVSGEFTHGFFRHPKPYTCSIVPRSPFAKELILAAMNE